MRLPSLVIISLIMIAAVPSVYAATVTIYPYHSYWVESNCSGNSFGNKAVLDEDPRKYTLFNDGSNCYASVESYALNGITGKAVSKAELNAQVQSGGSCNIYYYDKNSQQARNGGGASCPGGMIEDRSVSVSGNDTQVDIIIIGKTGTATKTKSSITLDVAGTNCAWVASSRLCGFTDNPWEAIKTILLYDYFGQWFYVLILLPIPMTIYLTTRNGAYAGFVSMGLMITFTQIDKVIFEVSLSMILISAGFLFYEVLRKRLFQQV